MSLFANDLIVYAAQKAMAAVDAADHARTGTFQRGDSRIFRRFNRACRALNQIADALNDALRGEVYGRRRF